MTRERIPAKSAGAASEGKDDILEQYLAETIDLRYEPAVLVSANGTGPDYCTLDGTRVFPFWSLVEMTGCDAVELKRLLDTRAIRGIQIGDIWYAAKEELDGYLMQ